MRVMRILMGILYDYLYGDIELFKEEGVKDMLTEKLILDVDLIMDERDSLKNELDIIIHAIQNLDDGAKLVVAQGLLDRGMAFEMIMETTKLPLGKIKELQTT